MPPTRNRKIRRIKKDPDAQAPVSTTTILDLNDYCLLDIFRLLSPLDMCSVFDTCKRFRTVAEIHSKNFYRSNELVLSDQQKSSLRMLCKFGTIVKKMKIELLNSYHQHGKTIFSMIRKLKPKLEKLTLAETNYDFRAALTLSPLLGSVRQLRIEYVNNDSGCDIDYSCDILSESAIKELLRACKIVEEFSFGARMSVMGSRYQGIFLQQKFKQIRSLEIYDVLDFDVNNLKIFLKLNPNVQRISLKRCICLDRFRAFDLAEYAPNIEVVELGFSENDHLLHANSICIPMANVVSRFERLKCLVLDTCHTDVTDLIAKIAKRNTITQLSLVNVRLKINEGLAAAFTNMTNLTVLRLHIIFYFDDADFFKNLCTNLVKLEELHLAKTMIKHEHIADIVEHSHNLRKLYFPSFERVGDNVLNEDTYSNLVQIRRGKDVTFPLTLFLKNDYFGVVRFFLRSCALARDVINVQICDDTDFDEFVFRYSQN